MFTVVRNVEKAYYVVCQSWIKQYVTGTIAYYPPEDKLEEFVKKRKKLDDKWDFEEVEIMQDNFTGRF